MTAVELDQLEMLPEERVMATRRLRVVEQSFGEAVVVEEAGVLVDPLAGEAVLVSTRALSGIDELSFNHALTDARRALVRAAR